MIELLEKQYLLDGVRFGLDCPVEIKSDGWMPGSPELRTADTDNPGRHGVRLGRTLKGVATWAFSLYTNAETEAAAWDAAGDLAAVWTDEEMLESQEVVPLQYCLAGQQRMVYGQPRRFTATPGNLSMSGRIDIESDFVVVDDRSYEAEVQSLTLSLGGTSGASDSGFTVPFTVPFTVGAGAGTTTGGNRTVRVRGRVPTPITVKFSGQVTNPAVTIGGWTAAIRDTVEPGDPVTVDGRPWIRAATRQSGGGVEVSPRITRISRMWLPPGDHIVSFSGEAAGGATAQVSWQNAHRLAR